MAAERTTRERLHNEATATYGVARGGSRAGTRPIQTPPPDRMRQGARGVHGSETGP
jgi:hypothetical protein